MAFVQSLYNQNSVLKINVMVVDDDPVFLQIMAHMLENFKYRDPSIMEIKVIAVRDPREALSTLKIQRNNIDLIVTDYYMPGMNGLELKKQITREFGNLPVIVMSSDTNKEHECLTYGAMCFIPKPITATDITKIYQLALTYKRNGKFILRTEHNHKETDVGIPQQIQLLPEQANVLKTKKKKTFSSRTDSRSMNSSNGNCVSTDGSRENQKRRSNCGSGDDVESLSQPSKKRKIQWSDNLHDLFLQAIRHIGLDKAVPKKILEFMNVSYLTRENVASHLQKYRQFLRKVAEQGSLCSSMLPCRDINSRFPYAHIREPYYSNYTTTSFWYNTILNNRTLCSNPRQGLGQSRLLSNTSEPVRFNQMPYNYMNRLSTHERHRNGSNLTLPIKTNISFSTQPSQNEERNSFFKPTVMANTTGQTSQVLGFGKHGLSAISATIQPNLEIPQLENLSLYDDLGNTSELPCDISNFQFNDNKQQEEAVSNTKYGLSANFQTELDKIFSLEEDGDWTFLNINQGHSNEETSNTFAAPETNYPIFNFNSNHDQEQDVPDFVDWSSLDPKDLANDYDFMDSLFTNDMN